MMKLLSCLKKRDGITSEAFKEYYETNHVPLILSLAPSPTVYKRHYLIRGDAFNLREDEVDFDVVTEMGWEDRDAFQAWMTAVSDERVGIDEARFLDRSRTRAVLIDDRVTAG
ncbi:MULTISPECIES: EthD domain-containing protein [unclassified Streptomyces]|uniref:EthD domain-containing protein n=1 Tax=unclassified Streptomyces TaxID=2593676 RepID=UPI003D905897